MNRAEAETRIKELLGEHAASQLTAFDIAEALSQSALPDADGVLPGQDGWAETFDSYWAAAQAALVLEARLAAAGGVAEFTSEGATFKLMSPSLAQLATHLMRRSPLYALNQHGAALGEISIDTGARYIPTSEGA